MDDLDQKIDSMQREKLYNLFEENSVRLGKINIRYTTKNQKLSVERLNDAYASFERMIRAIPKELLNIEKKARIKYQVPFTKPRQERLQIHLSNEIDRILKKIVADYRTQYAPFGQADAFDQKVEQSRADALENVDRHLDKLAESLGMELGGGKKIEPAGIHELYGIDEQTQLHLQIVDPIRKIHEQLHDLEKAGFDPSALETIHKGIAITASIGKKVEAGLPPSHMVAARKEWKMRVAREALDLKQFILCIEALAGQLLLPGEARNQEVVTKNWKRIEETLAGKEEAARVYEHIEPFYALLAEGTSKN